jgi:hypothetical protein
LIKKALGRLFNNKGNKMHKEKETKKEHKQEHKEMMQLRSGVFELKKELKKHEGEPMNKAHPKTK